MQINYALSLSLLPAHPLLLPLSPPPSNTERNGMLCVSPQMGTSIYSSDVNFWGFDTSDVITRGARMDDFFLRPDPAQPAELLGDVDSKLPVELVDATNGNVYKRYMHLGQLAQLKSTSVKELCKTRGWANFAPFKPSSYSIALPADGRIELLSKPSQVGPPCRTATSRSKLRTLSISTQSQTTILISRNLRPAATT